MRNSGRHSFSRSTDHWQQSYGVKSLVEGCKAAEISLLCVFLGGIRGILYLTPLRLCRNEVSSLVCKRSSWIRSNESKPTGVVIVLQYKYCQECCTSRQERPQYTHVLAQWHVVQVAIGELDQIIDDLLDDSSKSNRITNPFDIMPRSDQTSSLRRRREGPTIAVLYSHDRGGLRSLLCTRICGVVPK